MRLVNVRDVRGDEVSRSHQDACRHDFEPARRGEHVFHIHGLGTIKAKHRHCGGDSRCCRRCDHDLS